MLSSLSLRDSEAPKAVEEEEGERNPSANGADEVAGGGGEEDTAASAPPLPAAAGGGEELEGKPRPGGKAETVQLLALSSGARARTGGGCNMLLVALAGEEAAEEAKDSEVVAGKAEVEEEVCEEANTEEDGDTEGRAMGPSAAAATLRPAPAWLGS